MSDERPKVAAMVYLTQLVYLNDGKDSIFHAFEDAVLPLIPKHGGELLLRVRPNAESIIAAGIEVPYEVHLVRFKDEEGFTKFMADEARQRVLHMKKESVRASIVVQGSLV